MSKLTAIADAEHAVDMSCRYNAIRFEPITENDGSLLGWTFGAHVNCAIEFGWVLTDGRISPATEWTRDDAEAYARRSV